MTLILSGTDNSVSAPAVQGGTGGTTTGVYYPATNQLALATNGTQALLVDSSQNVGIGVTPSAWVSGAKALEMPYGAFAVESNGYPSVLNNAYEYTGGSFKYRYSGLGASRYIQSFGSHIWGIAGSGTAGNVITFTEAMRIDASGNLLFNSGYGSAAVAYGCRAFVLFDGYTGSGNTISKAGNVSSITRNSTGNYNINFTNAMPDVNYCAVGNGEILYSTLGPVGVTPYNYSTTYLNVLTISNSSYVNSRQTNVAIFR